MQIPKPLANETAAKHGFTHEIKILAADLAAFTTAATGGLMSPAIAALAIGQSIERIAWELITPFQDTTDTGNNTSTVQVKLGSTSLIAATEVNANGSFVSRARSDTLVTPAAASNLTLTWGNPASGKTLAAFNVGELRIFWQLSYPGYLATH